jgi:hypothetical protein
MAGAWQFNFTETLGPNEYCKIEVDATAYIARVILDDSVTLGVRDFCWYSSSALAFILIRNT